MLHTSFIFIVYKKWMYSHLFRKAVLNISKSIKYVLYIILILVRIVQHKVLA